MRDIKDTLQITTTGGITMSEHINFNNYMKAELWEAVESITNMYEDDFGKTLSLVTVLQALTHPVGDSINPFHLEEWMNLPDALLTMEELRLIEYMLKCVGIDPTY